MAKKAKHKKNKKSVKSSKRSTAISFLAVLILAVGILLVVISKNNANQSKDSSSETVLNQDLANEISKSGDLKTFSGAEFRDLYNGFAYPNTEYISDDAVITGNPTADTYITKKAEERGYIRRSAPVLDTFREIEPNMQLQERASQPWEDLKSSAKEDGITLFLTAAYRSAEEQRRIFLERLAALDLTENLILSKLYDEKLDEILATTAIPGYSRHHTGYTVDIGCGNDPGAAFEFTVCYEWLSAENYKNAKTFGWIPSYPENGGLQGPEPETWEYVWVGVEAVSKDDF